MALSTTFTQYFLSCTFLEIQHANCPKSLYLATPLAFIPPPPTEGFSWNDIRKIFRRDVSSRSLIKFVNNISSVRQNLDSC